MRLRALCALLVAAPLLLLGKPAEAAAAETLTGIYNSGFQDRPARLKAVFTPTDAGAWSVDFHFSHGGRDLNYSGTAHGSLTEGDLQGRVVSENGSRTFSFQVNFENRVGTGRHAEIRRGREADTGPLTLEP